MSNEQEISASEQAKTKIEQVNEKEEDIDTTWKQVLKIALLSSTKTLLPF